MKTKCIQAKAKLALWQQLTLFKFFSLWTKLKNIAFFFTILHCVLLSSRTNIPPYLPSFYNEKAHKHFSVSSLNPLPTYSISIFKFICCIYSKYYSQPLKTSLWAGLPHEVLNFCARAGCFNLKIFSRGYYCQEVSVLLLILFSYTFVQICGNKKHFNVITRSKWRTISNRK